MDPDPGAAPIWFDSHCHIQDSFAPDDADAAEVLAAELAHCFDAGVGRVVCVGTDLVTSKQALAVCEAASGGAYGRNVPEVYASIGLHPHEASAGTAELVDLAGAAVGAHAPGLVAIGECGLDYFYEHSDRSSQRRAFAEQVGLAQRLGLTLVIHARDAWEDLFDVLGSEGVPERTVLHCFTGGPTEAARCVEAGMFVSFSGIITFKNADDVRAAATVVPLERLLIETDSPFLAPVPHRGKRNEPALVPLVGAAIAAVRGLESAEVAASSAAAAGLAFAL